ncbi:MAG: thioredoxin domain-containing protein, partial [Chloroflexi bacterium]|nr:thioredoxin domain-containing protein [Chloroflexota bacterium]
EYGDLGCSACKAWHNAGIKEQLQAEFGEQVVFEYRHFPVITAYSPDAAEGAQCAAEQDAFWPFHDYIYENLTDYPPLDRDSLKSYATSVGLDRASFDECLDSRKYESYVYGHAQDARAAGARGTPTFLVGDELVPLPSYENLSRLISAELGS